jgi:predicted transglutaminase-like cysteine proteinase
LRIILVILFAITLTACGGMPDGAGSALQNAAAMPAPQPVGAKDYCAVIPAAAAQPFWDNFCQADAAPVTVALTPERWNELASIQNQVDGSITYNATSSWDPLSSVGDCKTYSAATALTLLEHGWPAGAVRIATAFVNDGSAQQGASHAVVLVDTDKGTIVLDSRQAGPRAWESLSYIWLSAEIPGGHGNWNLLTTDVAQLRSALLANLAAHRREQFAFR